MAGEALTAADKKLAQMFAYADKPMDAMPGFSRHQARLVRILNGGGDYGPLSSMRSLETLSEPPLDRFCHIVITEKKANDAWIDASQRMLFASYVGKFADRKKYPETLPPTFAYAGEAMLEWIATGRDGMAAWLDGAMMGLLRADVFARPDQPDGNFYGVEQKIGVFAMEMLAAMRGETIDWESFHMPADRFWLECARSGLLEPDAEKAGQWISELCDAYLGALQTDADNFGTTLETGHEVERQAHFMWPIAVHAFVRLRRQKDLPVPEVDHRLLRTPFSVLEGWTVKAGAWGGASWFTEILDLMEKADPEIAEDLKLARNG